MHQGSAILHGKKSYAAVDSPIKSSDANAVEDRNRCAVRATAGSTTPPSSLSPSAQPHKTTPRGGLFLGPARHRPSSSGRASAHARPIDGVARPNVSKTEGIKASATQVSPRNHAMTWCFRFHAVRGSGQYPPFWTPGAVSGPHHFCIGPDWDIRGHSGLVVGGGEERHRLGFGADDEDRESIIKDQRLSTQGVPGDECRWDDRAEECMHDLRSRFPAHGRSRNTGQGRGVQCPRRGADESRGSVTRVGGRSPAFGAKTPAPPKPLALTMRHPGHRLPRILSPPSGHPPPPRTTATSHANTKEFMNEPRGFGRVRRGCPLGVRLAWAHCRRSLK